MVYKSLPRGPVKAVLFDNDGVLIASEPLHEVAWLAMLSSNGLPEDQKTIKSMIGAPAPKIIARLLDLHRPGWTNEQFDTTALVQQKNDIYLDLAQTKLTVYPGIIQGLAWLKSKKIKTAVVSNARSRELHTAHAKLGLQEKFDFIVTRDQISEPKPSPLPYITAAAALETSINDCVAIEDTCPGLEAAIRANIYTCAVLSNFSQSQLQSPVLGRPDLSPHWFGDSMIDFFDWLKSL